MALVGSERGQRVALAVDVMRVSHSAADRDESEKSLMKALKTKEGLPAKLEVK